MEYLCLLWDALSVWCHFIVCLFNIFCRHLVFLVIIVYVLLCSVSELLLCFATLVAFSCCILVIYCCRRNVLYLLLLRHWLFGVELIAVVLFAGVVSSFYCFSV